MKFSIIVPVYNVEKFLDMCLLSLIDELSCEYEIILVQGNSNDTSRMISKKYCEKYKHIFIIEQDGVGLSNARNCGLKAAEGEFVLFIDGDDFVDGVALDLLLKQISNEEISSSKIDVWIGNYYKYYGENNIELVKIVCDEYDVSFCENIQVINKHLCFWNVWKNIYRKSFLIGNDLLFLENTYAEDVEFFTRIILKEPFISSFMRPFYYYRVDRAGSLMNVITIERIKQTVSVLEKAVLNLEKSQIKNRNDIADGFRFEYLLNVVHISELVDNKDEAVDCYNNYKDVLSNTNDLFVNIGRTLIKCFGVRRTANFLYAIKKVKRIKEHRDY